MNLRCGDGADTVRIQCGDGVDLGLVVGIVNLNRLMLRQIGPGPPQQPHRRILPDTGDSLRSAGLQLPLSHRQSVGIIGSLA